MLLVLISFACACGGGDARRQQTKPPPKTEAADPMKQACEAGTPKSCMVVAQQLEKNGELSEAAAWYGKACEMDESTACLLGGGLLLESGDARAGALDMLGRGCELGEGAACYGAALAWEGSYGGERDMARAMAFHEKGCSAGLTDSCGRLATLMLLGDAAFADSERGQQLARQTCESGGPAGCLALGMWLRREGEDAEALDWFEKACEKGDGRGCTELGVARGTAAEETDALAAARRAFQRGCAADEPDPRGCALWGWSLWTGTGGDQDRERATALLTSACDVRDGTGCFYLAVARDEGGETVSESTAQELLEMACEFDQERCGQFREKFPELTGD